MIDMVNMIDMIYLIHAGKKGEWIYPYWWKYFEKYWDFKSGIDPIFLAERRAPKVDGIKGYATGDVSWSDGLINFLKIDCKAKYVLYTMEDFFLIRKPKIGLLYGVLSKMIYYNIHLVKLFNNRYTAGSVKRNRKLWSNLIKCDKKAPLLCSCLPSIWSRELLLKILRPGESGWDFERIGSRRLQKLDLQHYIYFEKDIFPYRETVRQGKIRKTAKRYFDHVDITGEAI